MFLNPSVTINNAISKTVLTTQNNDLYENGIKVATQTEIDILQQEIDNIVPSNPNALVTDTPLITPQAGALILSDGLNPFGTVTDNDLKYEVIAGENILSVGAAQVILANNNMKLESTDYILTTKDIFLQGTEDVQRYLTIGVTNQLNNVKTSVDITTNDYICDNQLATKTQWKGASEYDFDNDVKIGDASTTKKLYVNDVEITPSSGGSVSAGLLRAINCNQIIPTVAQTYNVVWSSLTPAEQAIWAGGSEAPVASVDNRWNFTKLSAGTQKINWTIPFDFLTNLIPFTDINSVYAVVRLNTSSNISAEGYMWFQIQSQNIVPDPPLFRTRWNYANSASGVMTQLGYTFKMFALDAIPSSNAASNTGKGQEPSQTSFKNNPCDVEPTLFSIPFSKFVMSPSGDQSAGFTSANVQSIALNTASNINTYNFDVLAIGFNTVRYNLFYV
jgi:hypothetical protein